MEPTTTLLHKQVDLTTVHPQYPTTHPLPFCNTSNMNPLQYQQYLPTYHFSIYTLLHLIPQLPNKHEYFSQPLFFYFYLLSSSMPNDRYLHTATNFVLLKARGPFLDDWHFVISSCQ